MKVWPSKDPDEILKFSYDFGPDLPDAVTLASAVFTPDVPAGTTVVSEDTDGTIFTAIISDGNDGEEARFTLRVTATDGQVLEDTVALPIIATSTLDPMPYPGGYIMPTPENMLAVFPELSTATPGQLDYYLQRAARAVDTSWTEGDYGHAIMLLAAHLMTLSGIGTTAEAGSVRNGSNQFRSMAISSLRLERFDMAKASSTFTTTRYGREFSVLLRQNRGGPRVTGATLPTGWGDGDKAWGPY